MSTLRQSGREVNGAAVSRLFVKLQQLWDANPLAFVEFVRHSRKRTYKPFGGKQQLATFLQMGLVDIGRESPVHDAFRDLVAVCVEGDGLSMQLFHPLEEMQESYRQNPTRKLRDGTVANCRLVDLVMKHLRQLLEDDYIAFVELVRLVRDRKENLYPGVLSKLLSLGIVGLQTGGMPAAIREMFSLIEDMSPVGVEVLLGEPVVNDLFVQVIQNAAVGTSGLDFNLQSPYLPEQPKAASSQAAPAAKPVAQATGQGEVAPTTVLPEVVLQASATKPNHPTAHGVRSNGDQSFRASASFARQGQS